MGTTGRQRTILLTNDDGYGAPGIELLARAASRFGRVVVVAPDRNRSGASSALSLHTILRLQEVAPDRHVCDGTPVDCVLLGLRAVLGTEPDWLLSGVNMGFNLGEDVLYSGTVAAAIEGALQGCRAAAFSMDPEADPEALGPWIEHFLETWEDLDLPTARVWNLNFPKGEPRGFRITRQGNRTYHDVVEQRRDPRGKVYYWIGGSAGPTYAMEPGSDAQEVLGGWASLTPLGMDLACPQALAERGRLEALLNGGAGAGGKEEP